MFFTRLMFLFILILCCASLQSEEVKKWTDKNGKVHYGDIIGHAQKAEVLEINDPAPEVTEGEQLMRMKNDLYFEKLELKREQRRLANIKKLSKKQRQQRQQAIREQKHRDSDRRACTKARLKIEDIKDDLRDGYSTSKGVQLEKKLKRQRRRVDVYC